MPWSIFTQGGGASAALTWADDLLTKIGAPLSAGNKQVVYDWEVSEGGGGAYNPLNEGPDPDNAALTSTGPQYGGGAADYVSWAAGLQGAADYLAMPNFAQIADDLRANDPQQARSDIIASPWAASHYGGGTSFSDSAVPGSASALAGGAGTSIPGLAGSGAPFPQWTFNTSTHVIGEVANATAKALAEASTWPAKLIFFTSDSAAENYADGNDIDLSGSPLDTAVNAGSTAAQDTADTASAITGLTGSLKSLAIVVPLVLAGGGLIVWGFARSTGAGKHAKQAAEIGAMAA